jgi:hypothetical protein
LAVHAHEDLKTVNFSDEIDNLAAKLYRENLQHLQLLGDDLKAFFEFDLNRIIIPFEELQLKCLNKQS